MEFTSREIELIDGIIEVQLDHANRCDTIANRAKDRLDRARVDVNVLGSLIKEIAK